MTNILIVEDDITFTQILEGFLKKNGFHTSVVHKVKDANTLLQKESFDLMLLDYRLPDGVGTDLLDIIKEQNISLPVIIMTSFHDVRTAVNAIRLGALDYITKPVNPDELLMVVKEALKPHKAEAIVTNEPAASWFIDGDSEIAHQLQDHIKLVAPTNMSVIIQGDSGTGKEQAAQNIHRLSKRADGPFIAIDCGALSEELAASELFGHIKGSFTGALQDKQGQFEAADGGTLFLDEVGNLSYAVQVKLLRAIQEREIQPIGSNKQVKVDVRIITATNDDLINSVREGKFREDLYHRINEFTIKLPALKERGADLNLFIAHFIEIGNKELGKQVKGLSPRVEAFFKTYDWPGNLRELKNIIKRGVLLATGSYIDMDALPTEMTIAMPAPYADLKTMHAATEKELIIKTLKETKNNKSKTARLLNIDRTTLYYKMSKYHIED